MITACALHRSYGTRTALDDVSCTAPQAASRSSWAARGGYATFALLVGTVLPCGRDASQ